MPDSGFPGHAHGGPAWISMQLSDIQGSAVKAILAVAAAAGQRAMEQLMEAEVKTLAGPKGKHDRRRQNVRHGTEQGSVIVAGGRVQIRRPRVRAPGLRAEIPLATYELFTRRDVLNRTVLEQALARVSAGEGQDARAAAALATGMADRSSAAIARVLIAATEAELAQSLTRGLPGGELAAMLAASVCLAGRACLAVIGAGSDGVLRPLLLAGYTSRQLRAAPDLVARLRACGVDAERLVLGLGPAASSPSGQLAV